MKWNGMEWNTHTDLYYNNQTERNGVNWIRMEWNRIEWKNGTECNDIILLGLCNFFRGHIQNFAQITQITSPLTNLIKKDAGWK